MAIVQTLQRTNWNKQEAAQILGECFPGREVVGVPGREILLGGGNIHCVTQQVPASD